MTHCVDLFLFFFHGFSSNSKTFCFVYERLKRLSSVAMQTHQNELLLISDFESFGISSIWIFIDTSQGPVTVCVVLLSLLCFYYQYTCLFLRQKISNSQYYQPSTQDVLFIGQALQTLPPNSKYFLEETG